MRVLRYCNHFLFSLTWIWLGLGSANKISKSFGKHYNQTSLCSIALHRRRVFSDASNYTSRISVATDQSQCWYKRIWPRGRVTWKYQSWSHLISKQNSISRILWPIWTFFRYFFLKGILFISTDFRTFLRHWGVVASWEKNHPDVGLCRRYEGGLSNFVTSGTQFLHSAIRNNSSEKKGKKIKKRIFSVLEISWIFRVCQYSCS